MVSSVQGDVANGAKLIEAEKHILMFDLAKGSLPPKSDPNNVLWRVKRT